MPGPSEWIVIAIVALVVIFGAKKIPEMARSMGRAQSEFKKGMKEGQAELGDTSPPPIAPPTTAPTPPPAAVPPPAAAPASPENPSPDERPQNPPA
jgi:TatA/E family protein of Tat protein translocase